MYNEVLIHATLVELKLNGGSDIDKQIVLKLCQSHGLKERDSIVFLHDIKEMRLVDFKTKDNGERYPFITSGMSLTTLGRKLADRLVNRVTSVYDVIEN